MRPLEQKPTASIDHFAMLDAMRGVGALTIVVGHGLEALDRAAMVPHMQAGVDLFFVLSGFVIGHAYQPRMEAGMTLGDYTLRRLIRLYPLVPVAVLWGLAVYVLRAAAHGDFELIPRALGSALFNAAFLPSPLLAAHHEGLAWPINVPLWSLTSELIVSMLFGLAFWKMRTRHLLMVAVLGAVLFALPVFRLHETNIGQYWNEIDATITRPIYPFCIGLFMWRVTRHMRAENKLPAGLLLVGMVALLCVPKLPVFDLWFGLALVWLVMPPVLYVCAFKTVTNNRLLRTIGEASYAVYVLHHPLLTVIHFVAKRWNIPAEHPYLLVAVDLIASLSIGYLVARYYDEPVRKWLTGLAKRRATARAV